MKPVAVFDNSSMVLALAPTMETSRPQMAVRDHTSHEVVFKFRLYQVPGQLPYVGCKM